MKVAVVGLGYVGLSLATLLSKNNEVVGLDVDDDRVYNVNKRKVPIKDKDIERFFRNEKLDFYATLDYKEAFTNKEFIIICTPTNYDEEKNIFNTSSVEETIEKILLVNPNANIVIKSTVPIGFTEHVKGKYNIDNIFFSPEFLREGLALYDNLYPSRIIVGATNRAAKEFANMLKKAALKKRIPVKYMSSTEAEAVKLFSNTYLALRIAFFNELDTYAELKGLNTKRIIDGVCSDYRIGNFYNNTSFGYGGYCLPKDTKQLLSNYQNIPQNLIGAIISSNYTRKKHIVDMVTKCNPNIIGVYRLVMKKNSDNFRESAIIDIINYIRQKNIEVVIYEPMCKQKIFNGCRVINDMSEFMKMSEIILANRKDENTKRFGNKLYTKDLFERD